MVSLAVFLGNPGKKYALTRHNIPRMLLEELEKSYSLYWREKFHGRIANSCVGNNETLFLLPLVFMNTVGKSVSAALNFYKFHHENTLIIHDDLELPLGTIAWRFGGGCAGHNGLRSIRERIGSENFWRLRIGIGRPQHGNVSSWVISKFAPDEVVIIENVLPLVSLCLQEKILNTPHISPEKVTLYHGTAT